MTRPLRRAAKTLVASAFHHSGALRALARARRAFAGPQVHVIGFHRVVDDPRSLGPLVMPSLCISTRSFARLMELAAQRFEVLSLDDGARALAGARPLERDALVITFDDGYRDVFLRARPILHGLGLPATVFVPTGFVDSMRPLLHDRLYALLERARTERRALSAAPMPRLLRLPLGRAEALLYHPGPDGGPLAAVEHLISTLPAAALNRVADAIGDLLGGDDQSATDDGALVMSRGELRACAEQRIALGAHTVDHVVLTHEPPARVKRELERPRRDLEAITDQPCTAFAYCNGMLDASLLAEVRASGYTVAVTTRDAPNRPGQELLAIHRKVFGEGHTSGLCGGFSPSLAAAQLHDLYGALGATRPAAEAVLEEATWRRSA